MARPSPYTEEQKASILEAVTSGRKGDKKWTEILKDAEVAGYKGGLQYLMKLARKGGAVPARRGRKAKATVVPIAPKKMGSPKGSKNAPKRGPGRPKASVSSNGAGLGAIDSIVEKMVQQRLSTALSKAVASLEHAVEELKSI